MRLQRQDSRWDDALLVQTSLHLNMFLEGAAKIYAGEATHFKNVFNVILVFLHCALTALRTLLLYRKLSYRFLIKRCTALLLEDLTDKMGKFTLPYET